MNLKIKAIIKRALQNGFDLSSVKNYDPKIFMNKLYTYLVDKKYFCFAEENITIVSDFTFEDLAELEINDYHLKITPMRVEGMFDLVIEIFRFVADNPDLKPEDEETTEEDVKEESEDDSEEFDWI